MFTVAVILFIVTLLLNLLKKSILWLGFQIGSFTYGALLGVFLLGVTVRRGSDRTNLFAMLTSVILIVTLWLLKEFEVFAIGWTWYVVIATAWTYIIGFILSPSPTKQQQQ
jgi:Na+/proline symporter